MTYGDAKEMALQILNQYSNGGVIIQPTDGNTLDYTLRFPKYFDVCQKEIATTNGHIPAMENVSLMTVPSLMSGDFYSSELFMGTDITDMVGTGALSYTLEADNPGTHFIEECISGVWTLISTITVTNKGSFQLQHGFIAPSNQANSVRIRHSGTTPYQVRNRALYACTFSTANDIQQWTPMIQHTLPTGFWRMNKVLDDNKASIGWMNIASNQIAFDRSIGGGVDIYYWKMPDTIADNVDDSYVFELSEDAAAAMPFGVASMILRNDLSQYDIANILLSLYQQKIGNLMTQPANGCKSIKNSMFKTKANNSLLHSLRH